MTAGSMMGCVGSGYRIERTVGGTVRSGPFVPPYAYEHYVRGELALAEGDPRLAATELTLARSGADDDPLLCARLATALHRAGATAEAQRAIDDGLSLDPHSEAVHLAAGEIDEAQGALEEALAHYEAALSAAPRSLPAIEALVSLLDRMGDPERAARVLSQHAEGARIESAVAAALADGDIDRAMRLFRLGGRFARSARVRTAEALLSRGRPVLAAEVLAPLEGTPPELSTERRVRILVAVELRDTSTAESLLALPLSGDATELLADARAFVRLERPELGEELARAAIGQSPSFEADVVLATALLAQGRADEAARLASRIPAGSSVSAEAREVLLLSLDQSGLPSLGAEIAE